MSTTDPAFDALVRVWSDENGDLRYPLDVLKALRASGWDVIAATPAPLDARHAALVAAAREVVEAWEAAMTVQDDDGLVPCAEWEAWQSAHVALRAALKGADRG